ncbi:TetR/AcrR family transcriptional regulator [Amycolatopsis acidicola]|uniref:TetR/AcrR family transcriptional regulator n=1 Tax=Amycolatopsis acidicola TaxID=2596893 RepID=A0A5N0V151_9PSEU|nr:TetR/AcrR family transcriptional regulator [Amycolatopsis acidicola]KAA9158090.1 TetR/AcrR family transcriptional regulator [Amycolatopsis acidicola]
MTVRIVPRQSSDRRVLRSRSALLTAAVSLVSERGTTAVSITELARAAGVSRQLVYLHFGDRDSLLVAAAIELARGELPLERSKPLVGRAGVLAAVRHFDRHRVFYRAMLTGSCAFAMTSALTELLAPVNREIVRKFSGARTSPEALDDLATFVTGGTGALMNAWLLAGAETPEQFTDRLLGSWRLIAGKAAR